MLWMHLQPSFPWSMKSRKLVSKQSHTWLLSQPNTLYTLYVLVKRCAKRHVKRLRSPIHILTAIFRLDSTKIKKILAVHTHPKDRGSPPVHLDIPSNKDPQKGLMLQQLSESGFIQMDLLMEGKSVPQQS